MKRFWAKSWVYLFTAAIWVLSVALAEPLNLEWNGSSTTLDGYTENNQLFAAAQPFLMALGAQFAGLNPQTGQATVIFGGQNRAIPFVLHNRQPYVPVLETAKALGLAATVTGNQLKVSQGSQQAQQPQNPPASQVTPLPSAADCPAIPFAKAGDALSREAVQGLAKDLYDAKVAGQDLTPQITVLLSALGIPVLPLQTTQPANLKNWLTKGRLVALEPQVASMGKAFGNGVLVSLETFLGAAQTAGYTAKSGSLNLTRLTCLVKGAQAPDISALSQFLLNLVSALGVERATREGGDVNPVWGDRWLDPLQYALLSYSFAAATLPRSSAVAPGLLERLWANVSKLLSFLPQPYWYADGGLGSKVIEWLGGKIEQGAKDAVNDKFNPEKYAQDKLGDQLDNQLGVPTDAKKAATLSLCDSLILYGYKVSLKLEPGQLFSDKDPRVSKLTGKAEFQDDYKNKVIGNTVDVASLMNDLLGCKLPEQGAANFMDVEWPMADPLPNLGNFDLQQGHTNDLGEAYATYRTFDERVPKAYRVTLKDDTGRVTFKLSGAASSAFGKALEYTTSTSGKALVGDARLTVRHYAPPKLKFHFKSDIILSGSGATITSHFQASFPLEAIFNGSGADAKLVGYQGKGNMVYQGVSISDPEAKCKVGLQPVNGTVLVRLVAPDSQSDELQLGLASGLPNSGTTAPSEIVTGCPPVAPQVQGGWDSFNAAHKGEIGAILGGGVPMAALVMQLDREDQTVFARKDYVRTAPAGKATVSEHTEIVITVDK